MYKGFVVTLLVLFSGSALADQYFDNLRNDQTIPQHCKETKLSHFKQKPALILVSINGAKERGFDIEYPLSRYGATLLWNAIRKPKQHYKALKRAAEREPSLLEYFAIMQKLGPKMDVNFGNEGDVLEILTLVHLREFYDPDIYFFYGGAAYHEAGPGRTIGELDIIVAQKDTCEVIAIGEAKLGVKSLGKARGQLHRFLGFWRSHN